MRSVILVAALLICCGCGVYTFTGHGIAGIKTIAVEPFENRTSEFGIRDRLTDALVDKLLSDRTLMLAGQAAADAVLRGVIVSVDDRPLTYSPDEEVSEYQVIVSVEITLTKRGEVDPVWQSRLSADGSYPYRTGSPDEREEGLDKAVSRLVQDLVDKLTSDW